MDFNPRSPRGERRFTSFLRPRIKHFNPRSPRGERRDTARLTYSSDDNFNPRSPRGERLLASITRRAEQSEFQSTLPARGATYWTSCVTAKLKISIHAPREGSDAGYLFINQNMGDFNPRSPRGERPRRQRIRQHRKMISIHAPREGSDGRVYTLDTYMDQFQSTLPARGATVCNL